MSNSAQASGRGTRPRGRAGARSPPRAPPSPTGRASPASRSRRRCPRARLTLSGLEHRVGLPDAGRGAEEDLQSSAPALCFVSLDPSEQSVGVRTGFSSSCRGEGYSRGPPCESATQAEGARSDVPAAASRGSRPSAISAAMTRATAQSARLVSRLAGRPSPHRSSPPSGRLPTTRGRRSPSTGSGAARPSQPRTGPAAPACRPRRRATGVTGDASSDRRRSPGGDRARRAPRSRRRERRPGRESSTSCRRDSGGPPSSSCRSAAWSTSSCRRPASRSARPEPSVGRDQAAGGQAQERDHVVAAVDRERQSRAASGRS